MNKLLFLGTGCGDSLMLTQKINTSGLYFEINGLKFILDPGPGSIVNANKYGVNLLELNGLIVTHPHPDHATDANPMCDALRKPGTFLMAGEKCLIPSNNYYPVFNKFQLTIPEKIYPIKPGSQVEIGSIIFQGIPNNHLDIGLGIKIIAEKKIAYVGDGDLEGINKYYQDMDLIIFNIMYPIESSQMKGIHANADAVIEFLLKTKPKKAIIQHYTKEMLEANVDEQANIISKKTGVEVIAAKDGMEIEL